MEDKSLEKAASSLSSKDASIGFWGDVYGSLTNTLKSQANGAIQLSNHVLGTNINEFEQTKVDNPNSSWGAWSASLIGQAGAIAAEFTGARKLGAAAKMLGGSAGSATFEAEGMSSAFATGMAANDTAATQMYSSLAFGGVMGGVLTPSNDTEHFWQSRFNNAASSMVSMGAMTGISLGSASIAARLGEGKLASTLANGYFNNAVGGYAGGVLGDLTTSALTGKEIDWKQANRSGVEFALVGMGAHTLNMLPALRARTYVPTEFEFNNDRPPSDSPPELAVRLSTPGTATPGSGKSDAKGAMHQWPPAGSDPGGGSAAAAGLGPKPESNPTKPIWPSDWNSPRLDQPPPPSPAGELKLRLPESLNAYNITATDITAADVSRRQKEFVNRLTVEQITELGKSTDSRNSLLDVTVYMNHQQRKALVDSVRALDPENLSGFTPELLKKHGGILADLTPDEVRHLARNEAIRDVVWDNAIAILQPWEAYIHGMRDADPVNLSAFTPQFIRGWNFLLAHELSPDDFRTLWHRENNREETRQAIMENLDEWLPEHHEALVDALRHSAPEERAAFMPKLIEGPLAKHLTPAEVREFAMNNDTRSVLLKNAEKWEAGIPPTRFWSGAQVRALVDGARAADPINLSGFDAALLTPRAVKYLTPTDVSTLAKDRVKREILLNHSAHLSDEARQSLVDEMRRDSSYDE